MQTYQYELTIEEKYIDSYGHLNNAAYLEILEQARWDLLNKNDFSLEKIHALGVGPIVLEVTIKFLHEIKLHDKVIIETDIMGFQGKIGRLSQRIFRDDQLCCTAEFTIAFFDLIKRKIISPDSSLLAKIGFHE